MAAADFNWDMLDANNNDNGSGNGNDASTPPSSGAFDCFDPSAMLPSSEVAAQFELLVAELSVYGDADDSNCMLSFPTLFNDVAIDASSSIYDSDSSASTATTRSLAPPPASTPVPTPALTLTQMTAPASTTAAAAGGSFSREERRKSKQRWYEKNYRGRVRERRIKEEETWIKLEREFRKLLLTRASVVPRPRQSDDEPRTPNFDLCVLTTTDFPAFASSAGEETDALRRQFVELRNEEIALRFHAAYYKCLLAWAKALNFWGGQTDANRRVREQINALPSLQQSRMFQFQF